MKKKIILNLFILLGLFIITGCTNKENTTKDNETNNNEVSGIKNSLNLQLDYSASFNGISFKYPSTASYSNTGSYCIIDSMDNDDLLVRVAMSIYPGKTIGEVLEGSSLSSYDAVEYNGNMWNVYVGKQDDGKNIKNYITIINGDAYSIAFISDKETQSFEDEFMSNVK